MKQVFVIFFASLIVLACQAQSPTSSSSVTIPDIKSKFVSTTDCVFPGQSFWLGLHINLPKGWHTYWKNPGDVGFETKVKWDQNPGFEFGPLQWPYPERIEGKDVVSFGYHDEVYLLTRVRASAKVLPDSVITISGKVRFLVCEKACAPFKRDLKISLAGADLQSKCSPTKWEPHILEATKKLPLPADKLGLTVNAFDLGDKIQLMVNGKSDGDIGSDSFLFFPEDLVTVDWHQRGKYEFAKDAHMLTYSKAKAVAKNLKSVQGVLYFKKGWDGAGSVKAIQVSVPLTKP